MFDSASSLVRHRLDGRTSGTVESRDAAPQGRDRHDLSHDDVIAAPRGRHSHDDLSWALARIEARIEEIEGETTRRGVFEYLARNPGSSAGEIAGGLGVGQGAVSAHLYRGKGRLFTSRDGRWYPVPAADSSDRRW